MGPWLRVLQSGIQAVILPGTSAPSSVIGLEVLQPKAGAAEPAPLCGRACGKTPGPGPPPPAPHLELSRPCDLRKFLSRFLDRKATSSSLVLEWKWDVGSVCESGSVTGPE